MQNKPCQSYVLDEIHRELLLGEKKGAISDVEKTFPVKGRLYEIKLTAEIPLVFQVNTLTSISCVEHVHLEANQLDSLITIHVQEPTSAHSTLDITNNLPILQFETWDRNDHIGFYVPEIDSKRYSWDILIEKCLKIILKTGSLSRTIGIDVPIEISKYHPEFFPKVLAAVQNLPQNHKRPIYILLLVKTEEIKNTVAEILKKIADSKSDVHSASLLAKAEGTSSSSSNDECEVDVISGLITEQNVNVVVSSIDPSMELHKSGVANAIWKIAGGELQSECTRRLERKDTLSNIFATRGHKSSFQFFFFGVIKSYYNHLPKQITTFVEECLKKASDLGITAIAFPALGTGNLGYSAKECAAQMEVAIAKFKKSQTSKNSTLKKIIIVIHPKDKAMEEPFFDLKKNFSEFKDSKRADRHDAHENKCSLNYIYATLQWVQFLNYSGKRETLDQAISHFENYLKGTLPKTSPNISHGYNRKNEPHKKSEAANVNLPSNKKVFLNLNEAHCIALFYDLPSFIPDIENQLDTMQNYLLVPKYSADKFQKILNEFRQQYHTSTFLIHTDINKSHLEQYLLKIPEQYPEMKCVIVNNHKNVIFCAPNFEDVQTVKDELESFFGHIETTSFSPNRFEENNQSFSTSAYKGTDVPMTSSAYDKPTVTDVPRTGTFEVKQIDPLTVNSQNNQDVKCFQIERNFLIKVYQGNILQTDVDGIVNAANKWLQHGGGIAGVIRKAAGDIIHTEGQSKLNGRTLNDGDVVSTSAGNLKQYKYIIHAVGPMKSPVNSDEYCRKKISETILNTLKEASQLGLCSIAVPAISSNIFGVPLSICTDGYFSGVMEFCKSRTPSCQLNEVHFVDMNPATSSAIKDCFEKQLKNAPAEIAKNNVPQPKDNSSNISNNEIPRDRTLKEKEECPVCFEPNSNKLKCGHICCNSCIKKLKPPCCPMCRKNFDTVYGDQPDGTMTIHVLPESLPGFSQNQTYEIFYDMHCETDQTTRIAYMPKCKRGDHILKMLQLAFERRLIFTIGESRTTGYQNAITWNEIHHKTRKYTTPDNCYSYPDPEYFTKVTCELADKGITPDLAQNRKIKRYIKMKGGNVVHSSDF